MSQPKIEPAAISEEEKKREWDAFSARVRIHEERKLWNRGLVGLKVLRIGLVVGGVLLFTLSALPFFAEVGQLLPPGTQVYLDLGLLISAGAVLSPVWMTGRFAKVRGEIKALDDKLASLGTAGFQLFEAAQQDLGEGKS